MVLPSCWVGAYPLNTCHCFMDDCLEMVRLVRIKFAFASYIDLRVSRKSAII